MLYYNYQKYFVIIICISMEYYHHLLHWHLYSFLSCHAVEDRVRPSPGDDPRHLRDRREAPARRIEVPGANGLHEAALWHLLVGLPDLCNRRGRSHSEKESKSKICFSDFWLLNYPKRLKLVFFYLCDFVSKKSTNLSSYSYGLLPCTTGITLFKVLILIIT